MITGTLASQSAFRQHDRYPRGDASGRGEAEAYALGLGVPAAQIDWPE